MAKTENMHYTICLQLISSSGQIAVPPAFAWLEQRDVMVWSTHRTFPEGHFHRWLWVLLLPVLVSDLPSILATTLRHKSSHSSNLLSLRSPCCHDVLLARTYFQRLQRGSVCLEFDRRKAAGAESPRSSSCAVHPLPMWTQTQENWSVTWYACSVRLVDWLIAKPELGIWPGL